MRPIYILMTVLLVTAFTSCGKMDYKKSPSGLIYKIFGNGKGELIKKGDYIKFHIENKVNDSIYRSTFGKTPAYVQANYNGEKYDISELWTKLRKGDSVVILQSLDTFFKRGAQLPPEIKKGDQLIVTLKVMDVFTSDSAAQADQKMNAAALTAIETETLKKYFKEKNIEGLQKTPSGAFVKIINPGSGEPIDSGKYISVMYKGKTWSGKVFDTNMDSSFNHTEPLSFVVEGTPMMKGFEEGVKLLHKGDEATFYIPSSLGYGANGNPPAIQPNEHLIFDIKIVDVKDKAPESPATVTQPTAADTTKKR